MPAWPIVLLSACCAAAALAVCDLDPATRLLVDQLVLDRAAVVAAEHRQADDREVTLLVSLSGRDRDLRRLFNARATARRDLEAIETELTEVTAKGLQLVDRLSANDPRLADELAEFRRQMSNLAASNDPRRRAALARYAAGDRAGAMDVLIDVQSAQTAALEVGWRQAARRALAAYRRSEMPRSDALAVLDRAARLVDTDPQLWTDLAGVLREAGRPAEASAARERARALRAGSP